MKDLLENHGIDSSLLIPRPGVQVTITIDPNSTDSPFPCFLPLEVFDNTEYDCRTPEDWLALGVDRSKRKPVPGKALLPTG